MVSLIVCGLLGVLVLVLVVFRRARKERSVVYSAITIFAAMLMSVDDFYVLVDGWFGAHDYVHLASSILLMVGVFYFARGVTRVGLLGGRRSKLALGAWALIVAAFFASVGFFLTVRDDGVSSTTFMITYGAQPAAALYSMSQYAYLGVVLTAMAITSQRQLREAGNLRERVLARLLLIGSWVGVALAVDVIWMDVTHVLAWNTGLLIGQALYDPLQLLTFLFLIAGLAIAPLTRHLRQRKRSRAMRVNLDRVEMLWRDATAARPSVAHAIERRAANDEDRLHRRIVEIRDSALDNANEFSLTRGDVDLLTELESHLIAGTA